MLSLVEVLEDFRSYAELPTDSLISSNTRSASGETPLHWMAILGDAPALRLLLTAGAELNSQDDSGNTPMHAAVQTRQAAAVAVLFEAGARLDIPNLDGLTVLDIAKRDQFVPLLEAYTSGQGPG